jgi:hypothetical protein
MQPKLILVEGLPGSGKSTTATLIRDFLKNNHIPVELYLEGDLDHLADYDGVSVFTESEFNSVLNDFPAFKAQLKQSTDTKGTDILVPYKKLIYEQKVEFPENLLDKFYSKDVYELPLEDHIRLITENWQNFAGNVKHNNKTYIFECCYIQNPVTTAFIKYNERSDVSLDYVKAITVAIKDLNPLLVYVDQNDIDFTFRKALEERSQGWVDFFVNYYTNQGFGLANGLKGIEGTIEVLKQRAKLEKEIIKQLDIEKVFLNNSEYNQNSHQNNLVSILNKAFSSES